MKTPVTKKARKIVSRLAVTRQVTPLATLLKWESLMNTGPVEFECMEQRKRN
jgi:hypothetical protein